jgi:hypothetical protein
MSTGEVEVQDLTELTTLASGDAFLVIDDPSGTPAAKYVTIDNLLAALSTVGTDGVKIFDQDEAEYLQLICDNGVGYIRTVGTAPAAITLQNAAHADVYVFSSATEGGTKQLRIYGYRTGDTRRDLQIGVGLDAADTASFDGVGNYFFDGNVGIGTTAPSQILDCNAGSGNMIADGYDNHPSFSYLKEDIQPVASALDALVASPPKTFRRQPFVSAEELRAFALREHMDAWIAEFGGEINEDGELVGDDYRGDKLRNISDPELLVAVDAEADRLREERRAEYEWQRRYAGPIIDDVNIETNLPDMLIQNEAGEVIGWSLQSYAGYLHQALIELAERIAA